MTQVSNNCESCGHKARAEPGQHCTLFVLAPVRPCGHHTVMFHRVSQATQISRLRELDRRTSYGK